MTQRYVSRHESLGRITTLFRRPAIITFGLFVFLAGCAVTFATGYAVAWMIMTIWPAAGR